MSKQTDELLLHEEIDQESIDAAKKELERRRTEIAELKAELRLLQDLSKTPGFQLYLRYLKGESNAALSNMERTESPLDHTRTAGSYTALLRAVEYVPSRIQEITETLSGTDLA